jgi:DNA-binding MarR family transcriptional regulator
VRDLSTPIADSRSAADGTDLDPLARLLAAVATGLHDELRPASEAAACAVATGPALLVCALRRPGAATQELARAVGLSRSGAVRALDRLEASGLVLRRDASDHRSSLVWLSPAGVEAAQRVLDARYRITNELLTCLPLSSRPALLAALELLAVELSGRSGRGDALCRLCDVISCGSSCPRSGQP